MSVDCDLTSDVVENRAISIQKLRAGRKSRALGKLRAGIKCADQPPYGNGHMMLNIGH